MPLEDYFTNAFVASVVDLVQSHGNPLEYYIEKLSEVSFPRHVPEYSMHASPLCSTHTLFKCAIGMGDLMTYSCNSTARSTGLVPRLQNWLHVIEGGKAFHTNIPTLMFWGNAEPLISHAPLEIAVGH